MSFSIYVSQKRVQGIIVELMYLHHTVYIRHV